MRLNIDANVNEKVPEIGFPYPLTGDLRLTSAVEATATIGKQTVKLQPGKTCEAVKVEGIKSILVCPADLKAQGLVNVTLTEPIVVPVAEVWQPLPVAAPSVSSTPSKSSK